jgi:hypothetical protein
MESEAVSEEAAALEEVLQPAWSIVLRPEAPGIAAVSNGYATIDFSNTGDGYIMIAYTAATQQRIKTQITGPTTTYTYNLTPGQWTTFPLSDGNGSYTVRVFENVVDNRYAQVQAVDFYVSLADEFAPFIRPNQYVNYENAPATVDTAAQLTRGVNDMLTKVAIIYDFVVGSISYDYNKAATVQSRSALSSTIKRCPTSARGTNAA